MKKLSKVTVWIARNETLGSITYLFLSEPNTINIPTNIGLSEFFFAPGQTIILNKIITEELNVHPGECVKGTLTLEVPDHLIKNFIAHKWKSKRKKHI